MPSAAYLKLRIIATQNMIDTYEAAMLDLGSGSIQSYTLDTGQNRQTVVKMNITEMRRMVDQLYNRLATLEARLFGASIMSAPLW